jgi:pilus assembly protein CpaB
MNIARNVVLTIAPGAGGDAAYLARGSDDQLLPAEPVVRLQTPDILVASSDTRLGRSVAPEDLQRQPWPGSTASNSFIRRSGDSVNVAHYGVSPPARTLT